MRFRRQSALAEVPSLCYDNGNNNNGGVDLPFYNFKCKECDTEFEILASVSDKTEHMIHCPDCDSNELETLWKAAPKYLKGGLQSSQEFICPNSEICGEACEHAG